MAGAVFSLAAPVVGAAQDSYIYLESDRNTTFYTRFDNEPIAKPGSYHLFIPSITSGAHEMTILFADNSTPLQFSVNVLSGRGYGYFLSKDKDGNYNLQSMQANRRYYDGDTINETQPLPATVVREKATPTRTEKPTVKEPEPKVVVAAPVAEKVKVPKEPKEPKAPKEKKPRETASVTSDDKTFARSKPAVKTGDGPQFMDDIVLETSESTAGEKKKKPTKPAKETVEAPPVAPAQETTRREALPNSDCPGAVDDVQFQKLAGILDRRFEDQDRIEFLKSKIKQYCYSTEQIRQMAGVFKTQSGRFVMVKMLYPRTVDADNFGALKDLFDSSYLEKFNALLQ